MRAPMVVKADVRRECGGAPRRVGVWPTVRPFPQERLDKAFGFAIGARRIRPSEFVSKLPRPTDARERLRAVPIAVIGEQPAHTNAVTSKPPKRVTQERRTGALPLRRSDFHIGEAGRVIDRHMDVFPPAPAGPVLHGAAQKPM